MKHKDHFFKKTMFTSLNQIRLVLFSAILLVVIDFGIDEKEEEACRTFLKTHWQPGWGDWETAYQAAFEEVRTFLAHRAELPQHLPALFGEIKANLDPAQIQILLDLMGQIAQADNKEMPQETNLLSQFRLGLG